MTYTISSSPQLPVILKKDEAGGYVVSCPLFDGCFSQGDTIEEALTNIAEAAQLCLEDAIERGEIPKGALPEVDIRYITLQ